MDPVGAESLGTDPGDLQRSLPHLCARYPAAGTGESSVGAVGSTAWTGVKLGQLLKGFAPRGDHRAGGCPLGEEAGAFPPAHAASAEGGKGLMEACDEGLQAEPGASLHPQLTPSPSLRRFSAGRSPALFCSSCSSPC